MRHSSISAQLAMAIVTLVVTTPAFSQVATYQFNNSLAADQAGVTALGYIGPGSPSYTSNVTVFGENRTVYNLNGSDGSGNNVGVSLPTSALLTNQNIYSVETVFDFTNAAGWRKLADTSNRVSDSGFYVSPSSNLDIFPDSPASTGVVNANTWYDVILTNDGAGDAVMYLNGVGTSVSTTVMNNPNSLLSLFVDDAATGFNEYSPGQLALVRLYDGVLNQDQVNIAYNNGDPFHFPAAPPSNGTPEPGSAALLFGSCTATAIGVFRRRRVNRS